MLKSFLPDLPETPGVYIFSEGSNVIYVGKAINLKRRILSYFDINLENKTYKMITTSTSLKYIKVTSELESLLLEAQLIKKYMPHYNIISKDDKHPLYIVITKEEFPRIITRRKLEAVSHKQSYGPFPSTKNVYSVLKMIRKIFPYSDHKIGKRSCIYSHIGQCDPCPNDIVKSTRKNDLKAMYLQNIRKIKLVLNRKFNLVRSQLNNEMRILAMEQRYEEAKLIKDKIESLDYITQSKTPVYEFLKNPNLYDDITKSELLELQKLIQLKYPEIDSLSRIECFDIAHLAGVSATASMVVLKDGVITTSEYRHFRITQKNGASDYDSMAEIARRRKKHLGDWGNPNLIIVDGSIGQVNKFRGVIKSIPIVGIAKNPDRLILSSSEKIRLRGPALQIVARIRNEAHRFARRYHHKLLLKREKIS